MTQERIFLTNELPRILEPLQPEATGLWGKMGPQQMVEHVSGLFLLSTKPDHGHPYVVPDDRLEKAVAWLWTDKPFHENTKAPILPEEPLPLRFGSLAEANSRLLGSVDRFYKWYEENPGARVVHPFFGPLDHAQWERFHFKHVHHHFRQFSLLPGLPATV